MLEGELVIKISERRQVVSDLLLNKGGPRKERVIVLGTGWGAGAVMARIDPLRYEIVCVSPRNYFLMTPLLPSVTVGQCPSIFKLFLHHLLHPVNLLPPSNASPLRSICIGDQFTPD